MSESLVTATARASKSDSFKKLNPKLFDNLKPIADAYKQPAGLKPGKRIRQSSKPLMNKLETSFWKEYLKDYHPEARAQAVKFRLGNGIAYTPDFVSLGLHPVTCWEVKGPHAFRGGFENLKVAARAWPEIKWILVWKNKDGQWMQQKIIS